MRTYAMPIDLMPIEYTRRAAQERARLKRYLAARSVTVLSLNDVRLTRISAGHYIWLSPFGGVYEVVCLRQPGRDEWRLWAWNSVFRTELLWDLGPYKRLKNVKWAMLRYIDVVPTPSNQPPGPAYFEKLVEHTLAILQDIGFDVAAYEGAHDGPPNLVTWRQLPLSGRIVLAFLGRERPTAIVLGCLRARLNERLQRSQRERVVSIVPRLDASNPQLELFDLERRVYVDGHPVSDDDEF